jgi:hypothetical protein
MTIATIYALFADDIRIIAFTKVYLVNLTLKNFYSKNRKMMTHFMASLLLAFYCFYLK